MLANDRPERAAGTPGRPSKTQERRAQILAAFLDSLARRGLAKTSMGVVAGELGLDRSTVHHYFRSRDELLAAAMDFVIEAFRGQLDESLEGVVDPKDRVQRLLDYAFSESFNEPGLNGILNEFSLVSHDEPKAFAELRRAYHLFEDTAVAEVQRHFPDAPPTEVRRVAYAIVQLSEGSSWYASLGFGADRVSNARQTAELLLQQLGPT